MPTWVARSAPFDCQRWESRSPTASAATPLGVHDLYSAPLSGMGSPDAIVTRALAALIGYEVFPPHRMRHHVCTEDRRLRPGALVIQRLIAGPVAVEAAVRVDALFDERARGGRAGFTYTTLQGHVECGTASFSVGLDEAGAASLWIESWSRPGNALMALGRPFLRGIQRSSVHEAIRHVQAQVGIAAAE